MNKKNILGLLIVVLIIFFEVIYITKTLNQNESKKNSTIKNIVNENKKDKELNSGYSVSKNSASENVKNNTILPKEINVTSIDSFNKQKYKFRKAIETGNLDLVKEIVNNGTNPLTVIETSMNLNAIEYTEYLIENIQKDKSTPVDKLKLESILIYFDSLN